jgi:tetratricopeptide (TPR) repeat protein
LKAIEAAIKGMPDYSDKLGAIEAAIKALPNYTEKLGAIEAAIKALPDYREKLGAIEAAIKALPNYTEKMAALETALKTIADNIKAQQNQYADELAALKASIDAIKSEVAAGNKSQEEALAEIIALLESGALAGGGSGSGSGSGSGGSGGEGEGGEDEDPYITFKTDKETDIDVGVIPCEIKTAEGVEIRSGYPNTSGDMGYTHYSYDLISNPVKLTFDGNPTVLDLYWEEITEIDLSKLTALEVIHLQRNKLTKVDFSHNKNLKQISLYIDYDGKCNYLTSEAMTDVVASLPDRTGKEAGEFVIGYTVAGYDCPILPEDVAEAERKNWVLY